MMWRSREPRYDVASGISQGARDYQEDAITADFPVGAEAGFVVLADGMGGHAAGDVASKIVLTEVYSELKFHFADVDAFEARAPEILRGVAELANETLRQHMQTHPETAGMGATLVVPCLVENRLWWLSVGDSPLFLYRNGRLSQLNEDHSMAPQIDFMVKSGLMDAEVAAHHPDRNCLISVLMGTRIPRIDCPARPFELQAGDIVICASDGLQFQCADRTGSWQIPQEPVDRDRRASAGRADAAGRSRSGQHQLHRHQGERRQRAPPAGPPAAPLGRPHPPKAPDHRRRRTTDPTPQPDARPNIARNRY
ncbi:PP2C family protein-serine/threonine phosphatase, partial [Tabrizicola caldifontis]|uniref:PP2C family protein-serine/threonine phosphatase n=1 Tax=Tabrizicola caldifontis TaxID=2528036 RepID=UPI001F1021F0